MSAPFEGIGAPVRRREEVWAIINAARPRAAV
jgi:hypothetical protein